jgi:uncharacterized protein YjhX (UPF0386 family)
MVDKQNIPLPQLTQSEALMLQKIAGGFLIEIDLAAIVSLQREGLIEKETGEPWWRATDAGLAWIRDFGA